jgi:glycosyltransferase involved in cell wall biosynthesis
VGSRWRKLRAFGVALLRYALLLVRGQVGLLHLHASADASFWRKTCFAYPALVCRIPVVVHIHSGQFASFYADHCGPLRRRLVRLILERSCRVIALSPAWREITLKIAPRATVVCIPNPVLAAGGQPRQLRRRVVVFLGKVSAQKGVYDLIQAWRLVQEQLVETRLVIAGEGEVEAARQQVAALGLTHCVTMPGWVTGVAKDALLAEAEICVLPSYFEGMPMSLLEALGLGIPCVASTVGGIPDMITDGVEGRLVLPGDVHALAHALIDVLSDEVRYADMSRAALARFVSDYAADVVIPKLESLYAELGMKRAAVA